MSYSIYKIVCNDLSIKYTYVGSTINVTRRKSGHKSNCINENRRHYNSKVYKTIRDNGGWINWNLVVIESLDCNKQEAHTKERYWYEKLNADLNSNVPSRSKQEFRDTHKEPIKQYNQTYYQENKVDILKQQKIYKKEKKEMELKDSTGSVI